MARVDKQDGAVTGKLAGARVAAGAATAIVSLMKLESLASLRGMKSQRFTLLTLMVATSLAGCSVAVEVKSDAAIGDAANRDAAIGDAPIGDAATSDSASGDAGPNPCDVKSCPNDPEPTSDGRADCVAMLNGPCGYEFRGLLACGVGKCGADGKPDAQKFTSACATEIEAYAKCSAPPDGGTP